MGLVQKAFSDIITFSRSSNATRVGPTGLVEYAPHNLLLRSEQFENAAYTIAAASVTANAIAAPDGTVTADKLVEDSTNAAHYLFQTPTVATGTYSLSVYMKAAERSFGWMYANTGASATAYFDLANGTVGTVSGTYSPTATITSVGNGWYRCTMTFAATNSNFPCGIGVASANGTNSYTGNGTSGIYLWGAQLSVGPYALDYVPTTSAAVYGPRFDYDGSGVTIVEPVSRNLLLYSQEFENAAWIASVTAVTANNAIAPDGTLTADTATIQNTGYLVQTYTAPSSLPYVLSVWMRAASSTTVKLGFQSPSDVTSCNVTTTWQRFTHANVRNGLFYPQIYNDSGSAVTVELWGAQLEVGSTATGYMVSGATNGFRAVPVVSGSATARGLLVEEQRTNLCVYSESFNAGGWSGDGGNTVVLNSTTSPDGTVNAAKISFSSTTYRYLGITTVVSSVYTLSVFVKLGAGGNNQIQLEGAGTATVFNLSSGTVVSSTATSSSITSFGNGWYRCSCTFSASSTTTFIAFNMLGTFTSGQGHFFWGGQFELGSFATSYIPTVGSTVTRSADVASVNTLSPWFNASAGTLYAEGSTNGYNAGRLVSLSDSPGSASTVQSINFETTGLTRIYQVSGSLNFDFAPGAYTPQAIVKMAGRFNASNYAGVQNGGAVSTSSDSTTPPTMVYMALGALTSNSFYLNGHLRRVAYYPRALTNAELQALTA